MRSRVDRQHQNEHDECSSAQMLDGFLGLRLEEGKEYQKAELLLGEQSVGSPSLRSIQHQACQGIRIRRLAKRLARRSLEEFQ